MKEIIEKENIKLKDMIYEIKGVQVMLDSDIAKLYQVETKRVNKAVKNNPEKFPERFSWILTNEETRKLRSKFSTLEIKGQGKYSKYASKSIHWTRSMYGCDNIKTQRIDNFYLFFFKYKYFVL